MPELVVDKKDFVWLIKAAKTVRPEVLMVAMEDELSFAHVDPGNVYYIRASIVATFSEECKFGLNVETLDKKIGNLLGDEVILNVSEDKLTVVSKGVKYETALVDPSMLKPAKAPKLDLPVTITLPKEDLVKAITLCSKVSDDVAFTVEDGYLKLSASGDCEKVSYELVDVDKEVSAIFNAELLLTLVKLARSSTVSLRLGVDLPLELCSEPGGYTAVLAPRVRV